MKLSSLTLTNFCQHRDLTIEFPVGITGIIGANGSGKSTIAQALRFAILGESGNAGTKADDLNWAAAAAGEGGSVEWEFEKNGEPGKLKRAIQRAMASMAWGAIKERSVSGVNAEIMKLMGVSTKTLEDIVFVMQGRIERVLFDRPADRKKNFHALFGIDKAEDIRELLRRELTSLGVEPSDERIEQLQKRLNEEIDPQLKQLVVTCKELSKGVDGVDRDALQRIVTRHEESATLQQDGDRIAATLQELAASVAVLTQQKDGLTAQFNAVAGDLESREDAVTKLRAQIASTESAQKLHETIEQLKTDHAAVQAASVEPNPTPPGADQAAIDAAGKQVVDVRIALAPKQTFVQAFERSAGDPHCPTCGQLVSNASDHAAQLKQEIAAQLTKISAVESALVPARKALKDYERQYQQHKARVESAQKSAADIENRLAKLGASGYTPGSAALARTSRETVAEFEQALAKHTELTQQIQTLNTQLAGKDGQTQSLRQQLANLQAKAAAAPTDEDCLVAAAALQAYDAASTSLAHTNGQLAQLQQHRANTLNELEQLQQRASGMEAAKKYQELCERARTLFHHDCLPQVATQQYLTGLNANLNKYLQTFEVPFECTIDGDLSVLCSFPGVGKKPAERLSGGQRVSLSIAFRFAIYDMFAADLGFVILDEPTVMLDTDRVAAVADVLQSVRRHAHNTGMQLIVITHEQELMRSFDHAVQL